MSKRTGAYKSEKRKKELMRQKKQEAKRHKRTSVSGGEPDVAEAAESTENGEQMPSDGPASEPGEDKAAT